MKLEHTIDKVYVFRVYEVEQSLTGYIKPINFINELVRFEFLTTDSLDYLVTSLQKLQSKMKNDKFSIKSIQFTGENVEVANLPLYNAPKRIEEDEYNYDYEGDFDPFFEIDSENE